MSYVVLGYAEVQVERTKSRTASAYSRVWKEPEYQDSQKAFDEALEKKDWLGANQAEAKNKALFDKCIARCTELENERDKTISQIIVTGALITFAVRVFAGVCALAGVIMVSYWLGTGGTRPRGVGFR